MQIAKPPGGFNIVEPPAVAAMIAMNCKQWPRLGQHWNDIKNRLQQTGHREGTSVAKGPPGSRLFVADAHLPDRVADAGHQPPEMLAIELAQARRDSLQQADQLPGGIEFVAGEHIQILHQPLERGRARCSD
jgi:hypothetical protein